MNAIQPDQTRNYLLAVCIGRLALSHGSQGSYACGTADNVRTRGCARLL
jgi:hypothetical protein